MLPLGCVVYLYYLYYAGPLFQILVYNHYSFTSNQLTSTGAIVLSTALQDNKSLEELK